jgi:hypothetical protein
MHCPDNIENQCYNRIMRNPTTETMWITVDSTDSINYGNCCRTDMTI